MWCMKSFRFVFRLFVCNILLWISQKLFHSISSWNRIFGITIYSVFGFTVLKWANLDRTSWVFNMSLKISGLNVHHANSNQSSTKFNVQRYGNIKVNIPKFSIIHTDPGYQLIEKKVIENKLEKPGNDRLFLILLNSDCICL